MTIFTSSHKLFSLFAAMAIASAATPAFAVTVDFAGQSRKVLEYTADKQTGLDRIYVVYDASELSEMIVSDLSGRPTIQRYSNLGGGYAEPVSFEFNGTEARVSNPAGDMGYIIEDSGKSTYIWVVNYLPHKFTLSALNPSVESNCDNTLIAAEGDGGPIHYYTIDGRQKELSRELQLQYNNLEWSDDSENFIQTQAVKTLDHLTNPISITPPLYCNSDFILKGDRFLEAWGMGLQVTSPAFIANGVAVHTTCEQTNAPDDNPDVPSNMVKADTQGLGGSAPADFTFSAFATDAVIHNEWQIASDEGFEYIQYRFNQQNLEYTFDQEGTFYVRFVGSNNDGTCEAYGDVYTIEIGSSELRIPNAFSPNGDGVNDEWKVGYRSLTEFNCWIFDRYGNQVFQFSDPSQGWDGKYKGKPVKAGVYYYVIEARGADGKKYKKGGDINIIEFKRNGVSSGTGSGSGTGTSPAD